MSRALHAETTSYQVLLDGARDQLACQLLMHTSLNNAQIGTRLGYSETANFARAFRRWQGCTPQQFRSFKHPLQVPSPAVDTAPR